MAKLPRASNFGEMNPYRPAVPDSIRTLSADLYEFLSEQAASLRQQHNLSQAGDTTFPWEVLTYIDSKKKYTLGALGRFFHADYGIILARYVQFAEIDAALALGAPVGLISGDPAGSWRVTNQLSKSAETQVVGLAGSYEAISNDSFGWVIVSGVNLQTIVVDDPVSVGVRLGWIASGELGLTTLKFCTLRGELNGLEIAPGDLQIDSVSHSGIEPKQIEVDLSGIQGQINAIDLEVKELGDSTTIRMDTIEANFQADMDTATRSIFVLSEKMVQIDPEEIKASIRSDLNLAAQYRHLAGIAADNALAAQDEVFINLNTTNQFVQTASIKADEAGFYAESATQMANTATLQSNNSMLSAAAAAISESNAAVSATDAGTQAQAALTHATNAATSASNASTSATQASTSETNAAGSAATATSQATLAASSATTAQQTASNMFPSDFRQDGLHWTEAYTSATPVPLTAGIFLDVAGEGRVYQSTARFTNIATRGAVKGLPNRKYSIKARIRCVTDATNGGGTSCAVDVRQLNSDYSQAAVSQGVTVNINNNLPTLTVADGWVDLSITFTTNSTPNPWFRPRVYFNWRGGGSTDGNSVVQTLYLEIKDITESDAAAASATAAATSASTASTKATEAGASATSATTQANNAAVSAADAIRGAKETFPSGFENAEQYYYIADTAPEGTFLGYEMDGSVRIASAFNTFADWVPRFSLPAIPGRTYKATVKFRAPFGSAAVHVHAQGKDSQFGDFASYLGSGTLVNTSGTGFFYATHTYTVPASPPKPFIGFYWTQDGRPGACWAHSFTFEDITDSVSAASSATSASTSAATATTKASEASQSALVAASISQGAINSNAMFADWPAANLYPIGWQVDTTGSLPTRGTSSLGGTSVVKQGAAGASSWFATGNNTTQLVKQNEYYVIEADFRLNSGTLVGAGVLLRAYTSALVIAQDLTLKFAVEPDVTNTVVGDGVVGKFYRFRKLVRFTVATADRYRLYAMNHWTTLGSIAAANEIAWEKLLVRPASDAEIATQRIAPLEASVSTNATAIANLDTQIASAFFETVTNAGSATAAIRLKAETSPGVTTSSAALEAEELQLWNNVDGSRRLAAKVAGGRSLWTGDMDVGGSIRVGSLLIPVALQSFTVAASDGDVVSFGTDLGNIPGVEFDTTGLAPLSSGQSYDVKALSLTSTGFTMRAKIITPSSPTTYSQGPGSNVGGTGPAWKLHKTNAADSSTGYYTFTATLSVTLRAAPFENYEGSGRYECFVRPVGTGVWTSIGTISAFFTDTIRDTEPPANDPPTKVVSKTIAGAKYFADAIGQGADYEFGIAEVFGYGTITAFGSVSYPGQSTTGGESSATPSGQKVIVTILPQNL